LSDKAKEHLGGWIKDFARETAETVMMELQQEALAAHREGPSPLTTLFSLRRARELRKFCKHAIITTKDFSQTIMLCELNVLLWRHEIFRRDVIPEHLVPTDKEMSLLRGLKAGDTIPKPINKIMNSFKERRLLVGHIFYNSDLSNWHLIYFDQRDTDAHQNHWSEGSHVHLINCVVRPNQNAAEVWKQFCEGNSQLGSAIHIKCALD
jgi:uncharacterized protein YlbG (UPF0298 family)